MTPRSRKVILSAGALLAAVVCLVHGTLQWTSAVEFWAPCFAAESFDSPECLYIQYEAPVPWWQASLWPWVGETLLAVGVLVAALWAKRGAFLATLALAAVAVSNVVTDYLMGPVINGGYSSADSAPGVGYFGAVALWVAAGLYAVLAVWVVVSGRVASDRAVHEAERSV